MCKIMDGQGGKIKNIQATELHNAVGSLAEDKVKNILLGEVKEKPASNAKLFAEIKKKYFKVKTTEEMLNVLE